MRTRAPVEGTLARGGQRLAAIGPGLAVAALAALVVALADGWRSALLAALAAAALAATRVRFGERAALCLLLVAALLALGGWGPRFDSRHGGGPVRAAHRAAAAGHGGHREGHGKGGGADGRR